MRMRLWHEFVETDKQLADLLVFFVSFVTCVKGSNVLHDLSDEITDLSFERENLIADRMLTCEPFESKTIYPAKTWTCKNMKINGERLRYWVVPSITSGLHCGVKMDGWKGRNDFGALCRTLLKKHNIDDKLWAATISEASCDETKTPRALFVKDTKNDQYVWEDFEAGRGVVISFQCTILA